MITPNEVVDIPSDKLVEMRAELAKLEKAISIGINGFWTVGGFLIQVRDKELWRVAEGKQNTTFSSFQEYMEVRWDMSKQRGYLLMGIAEVHKEIGVGSQRRPDLSNEAALELKKIPKGKRKAIYKKAKANLPKGSKVKTKDIKNANHKPSFQKPLPMVIPEKRAPKGGLAAVAIMHGAPKVKQEDKRDYSDAYSSASAKPAKEKPAEAEESDGPGPEAQTAIDICEMIASWCQRHLNKVINELAVGELTKQIKKAYL